MEAVKPHYVRFHSGGNFYPFLVTHSEGEEDKKSGWVFAAEEDAEAGLSNGLNRRDKIGHGGPGINVSWSEYES